MKKHKILLVDDEENISNSLKRLLVNEEWELYTANNGFNAIKLFDEHEFSLVVSDYRMPGLNGVELLKLIKEESPDTIRIILTGFTDVTVAVAAINDGEIYKFIAKPWNSEDLKVQIRRAIEYYELLYERRKLLKTIKTQNEKLKKWNINLEKKVEEKTKELKHAYQSLKEAYLDTIHILVIAAEFKDKDTGNHIKRISRFSSLIAKKYGLSDEEIENILYATPMHDIGKIGVPDAILLKKGELITKEFEIMKTHSIMGSKILANTKSEILELAHIIAKSHHEKWNGGGYPEGLSGKQIPLMGRIVCLADVFDALTSKRPYKDPYPVEIACDIIKKQSGEIFDPDLVDIFWENFDEILKIRNEIGADENASFSEFTWSERDKDLKKTYKYF